ncbi:hypothetical protein PISMIDRAFT_364617 [Pisolithus microcarpus 441]|uniref:Uncharacterized protein n=1 Tax=Pisolithus microcarpus 441 TaxID=765257 RepID=A0A0C9XNV2_9AGAM|nr:hypothetical protein PISMIDRAFT_364617 [Pisolithus microcarpus 441]
MAIALLGEGDRESALCIFDLAFHDCELGDIRFILLLKSILVFESGNQEDAITCVELLTTRANDDNDTDAIYLYMQVRALHNVDLYLSPLIRSTGPCSYVHEEGELRTCNMLDRRCEEPSPKGQTMPSSNDNLAHIWVEFRWTACCCSATFM